MRCTRHDRANCFDPICKSDALFRSDVDLEAVRYAAIDADNAAA